MRLASTSPLFSETPIELSPPRAVPFVPKPVRSTDLETARPPSPSPARSYRRTPASTIPRGPVLAFTAALSASRLRNSAEVTDIVAAAEDEAGHATPPADMPEEMVEILLARAERLGVKPEEIDWRSWYLVDPGKDEGLAAMQATFETIYDQSFPLMFRRSPQKRLLHWLFPSLAARAHARDEREALNVRSLAKAALEKLRQIRAQGLMTEHELNEEKKDLRRLSYEVSQLDYYSLSNHNAKKNRKLGAIGIFLDVLVKAATAG